MAFWEEKTLEEMSPSEWEALCDGCGRCCLIKLEDEDTGKVFKSDVHCLLFDASTCQCSNYENRQEIVPDCTKITPENAGKIPWIPKTCAYRRLAEGRGLAWWHPLVCGNAQAIVKVGVSVRGRTVDEQDVRPGEWEDRVVDWPDWQPKDT